MTDYRQGEIRGYGPYGKVVVLSTDEVSNGGFPVVAPVNRDGEDIPPYMVGLADQDPIRGAVDVARLSHVPEPDKYLGEAVGLLSGATMERVRNAVLDLFEE